MAKTRVVGLPVSSDLEMIEKAVELLEKNNISPAKCSKCGDKIYLFLRAGYVLPIEKIVCDGCEADIFEDDSGY